MNHTLTALALITTFGMTSSITQSAEAKDPYATIAHFAGNKTMQVKIKGNKKLGVKPETFTQKVDVLHRGSTELDLFTPDGPSAVQTEMASDAYSWVGADGLTYRIDDYPSDPNIVVVTGEIFAGKTRVGGFRLLDTKHGVHDASGRWVGQLAFPGGSQLDLGLQVSSTPQPAGKGCSVYDTRVQFPGNAYESTSFYRCAGDSTLYSSGFFFLDSVSGNRWFISMEAEVQNGALQGEVYALPISGQGNSSWGKVYTQRPSGFSL